MWQTNTNWFEISIVTFFFLVGNIFLGHFEERSPRLKKLIKYFITLTVIILASIYLGRTIALLMIGLTLLPIAYIHGIVLPRKGINGWTGEPKSKYYDFRGWDKNIFKDK
jgi:hypothetical protein